MSFFKSLGRAIGGIARVASPILSVVNPALGAGVGIVGQLGARAPAAPPPIMLGGGQSLMPASFPMGMGALPQIGRALPAIGGAIGGAAIAGGRAVVRSAMTYCRRHPQWCATIGGTAAVAGMIESGQLPTIRRRRGRGITPRDLRSFKRVANLIRGFCPTVRRIPSRATRHVRGTGISHA